MQGVFELNLALGNVFSFIGSIFLLCSTFSVRKRKMMKWQTFDCLSNAIANAFLGGYSGCVVNVFSMIRNIAVWGNCESRLLTFLLTGVMAVLGLALNRNGVIGLLPVFASVMYTFVVLSPAVSTRTIKKALLVNLVLWIVYDCYVVAIPSVITSVVIACGTVINIIRLQVDPYSDNFTPWEREEMKEEIHSIS